MPTPAEILHALADADAALNRGDLAALSHLSTADAALAETWDELPPARRREVVAALAEMAEDDAQLDFESVFRERLADSDAEVRARAVAGLWESENPVLIPRLTRLLEGDPSPKVQAAAAQALGKFAALVALGNLREAYAERLVQTLLPVFHDETRELIVRGRALEAVAPLPLPEVAAAIREGFDSGERQFKVSALYAMGANCDPAWQQALTAELDNPDAEVRYEATTTLGDIGESASLGPLQTRLTDADLEVRLAAAGAIGKIGGSTAKKILQNLRTGDDTALAEAVSEALEAAGREDDPLQFGL